MASRNAADDRSGRRPPTRTTAEGYAADGDGWPTSGTRPTRSQALLSSSAIGAPGSYRRAVFAYDHADWYVREVFELAGAPQLERGAAAGEKLRRACELADVAREELRTAILAAHAKGASVRGIARAAAISYARAFQLIRESR